PYLAGEFYSSLDRSSGGLLINLRVHRVIELAAFRRQRNTTQLHLAQTNPPRTWANRAISTLDSTFLIQCAPRSLAQQDVLPFPVWRTFDFINHGDAACFHAVVQISNVQHPRSQVIDMGITHASDIRGHSRDRFELAIPFIINRL